MENEAKDYEAQEHLQDFTEDIKVKESLEVWVGMTKIGKTFKDIPDPELEKEVKLKEISQKIGEEILKKLQVESKAKVYEKILNELTAVAVANGTATDELKKIATVIETERQKGAIEKSKI